MRNARYRAGRALRGLLLLPLVFSSAVLMAATVSSRDVAKLRLGQSAEDVLSLLGTPIDYPRWSDGTRSMVYILNLPGKPGSLLYVDVSEEGRVLDIQFGEDEAN